jgi:transcription elongation factor Elf1
MAERRLAADQFAVAVAAVALWRATPDARMTCPACAHPGLSVADHSARPHAEWYRLTCAACGLDEMLAIPLGAALPGGDT